MDTAFDKHNESANAAVVLSVPHAGRDYPADIGDRLAVPLARARPLEDRYADLLVADAVSAGYRTFVARAPRLMIDLNRAETDFTLASVAGARGALPRPSHRARGGLGLVPDRLGTTRLWRTPIDTTELTRRVMQIHRPWHLAVETALVGSLATHGCAILLDLHSMPPLAGPSAPDIVLGDRHGLSAAPEVARLARDVFTEAGLRVAFNAPYAGAYILDRHGRPRHGISALQIEIDRRLYLDVALDRPGAGLSRMQGLIEKIAKRANTLAATSHRLLAAE